MNKQLTLMKNHQQHFTFRLLDISLQLWAGWQTSGQLFLCDSLCVLFAFDPLTLKALKLCHWVHFPAKKKKLFAPHAAIELSYYCIEFLFISGLFFGSNYVMLQFFTQHYIYSRRKQFPITQLFMESSLQTLKVF